MKKNFISDIEFIKNKDVFDINDNIIINLKFSIDGLLQEKFNEKNWTTAYNKNDILFKIKYDIRLFYGSIRKYLDPAISSYRKASLFWTRNPKLVNPNVEKRIWVQVIKNFESYIKLSEEEIKNELFDFSENITLKSSELGRGSHKVVAEIHVSWQKHDYIDAENIKKHSRDIYVLIT